MSRDKRIFFSFLFFSSFFFEIWRKCIFVFFFINFRHWREIHRLAGARTGLVGAIQRLMVNGKTYQNLAVNVTQHNTEIYDGLPCPSNENPCHNGGVCLPLLNSYLCKCATGYNGLHCEFCECANNFLREINRWKFLFFFNSNFSNSHGLRRVDGINGEAGPFQGWQFPAIQAPKRKKVNRIDRNYRINRSITFPSKFSISHNISPIKSHVTLASHLVKVLFRD